MNQYFISIAMESSECNFSLINTCRTCLKNNEIQNLVPIFETKNKVLSLFEGLAFTKLKVKKNDGLPQNICKNCLQQLCSAADFRSSCEKSQDILEKYFNKSAKNSENDIKFLMNEITGIPEDTKCNIKIEIDEQDTESIDHLELHSSSNSEDEVFVCKICNIVYQKESILVKHINNAHKTPEIEENDDNEKIENSREKSNKTYGKNKFDVPKGNAKFFCSYKCTKGENTTFKGFKSIGNLEEHMLKMHQCKICGKALKNLHQHMLSHIEERSFICDICSANFKTARCLKKHIDRHNPTKLHKCDFCDKQFKQKTHKQRHERTHTGERPLLCTDCGKGFSDHGGLSLHMRIHHAAPRRYKCGECDRAYDSTVELKYHQERVHSEMAKKCEIEERKHVCADCGKSYKRAEHLKIHIKRIHTQIRPFKCEVCGKGFAYAGELRPHMLVHTGERPHACPFCPNRFNLATSMRDHAMRIHKTIIHPPK